MMFCSAISVPPGCAAQTSGDAPPDLTRRVQELEKQLEDLRGQLAALRNAGSLLGTAARGATPAITNAVPAAPPATSPSLSRLLGNTTFSGFVDMYYSTNFNQPAARTAGLRSFDVNSNQFGLNLVELVADRTPDVNNSRTGYRIALGFGQAMNAVNGSDAGGLNFAQYLKEAYFSYLAPVGKGLQVDAGKFVTPHGAEVIETRDNWNYSRGLLFSYAIPYYHFGMRARYSFSDKYSLTGFFVNGWNNVVDNNTGKTYGLGLGWNPTKKISVAQNYMAGPEQGATNSNWRQLSDTVVTCTPNPRLSLMANYDYGRGDRVAGVKGPVYWTGIAGYVRYALGERYALATRYEYYLDHDGFTTGTAQHIHGFTGTFQRAIAQHLLTRLEFRRDVSNQPVFARGPGLDKAQNTFAAGMVYMFDSREGAN
ncbi:MAG TPA: porin [Terriglobales bacterium]|nr:porin [Terriglobales bacterium]